MIERLRLHDFTCFADADLHLGALNVFIGENGTGKTHLLKLLYLFGRLAREAQSSVSVVFGARELPPQPSWRQVWLDEATTRLDGIFVPDNLGDLVRWSDSDGFACVSAQTAAGDAQAFVLGANGKLDADDDHDGGVAGVAFPLGESWSNTYAAFLSARDVLLVDPKIRTVFKRYDLREEQTTWDLLDEIIAPRRKAIDPAIEAIFRDLASAIGGQPDVDGQGRVFIQRDAGQRVAAALAAQGHMKVASLALLLTRTEIAPGWMLCWDEPEANLNPALIKIVARAIVQLAAAGIQMCIATHSLFLLREIEILQPGGARYFGLNIAANGTDVRQGDTVDDIGDIRSLDEELAQSDRYMAKEYASAKP